MSIRLVRLTLNGNHRRSDEAADGVGKGTAGIGGGELCGNPACVGPQRDRLADRGPQPFRGQFIRFDPDSGTGLAEWWEAHGTADDTWAAQTYAELIDRAGPAGERHATTLSLALDMNTAARQIRTAGGGLRGAAAVLRQEMNTLVAALRSADLAPSGWLTPGQIAVILRSAYDPAIAATLERHGQLGQSLATAGPVAVNESWSRLRTDSAHHAVLWVSEWPRSLVYPGFLSPVLLSTVSG